MENIDSKKKKPTRRVLSEWEKNREAQIKQNMWKAAQVARKVSGFSGLPYEELRSVALEAMVKLYSKWDPEKANFSTWLNRSLTFQVLNYLRDSSRMVKMPRSYADAYMKIRKIISREPEISTEKLVEITGLSEKLIRETREAFQTVYQDINEDTEICSGENITPEDTIAELFQDHESVLGKLKGLPPEEYSFLQDVYIHKRAHSTLSRKYQGLSKFENIDIKAQAILSKVMGG